MMSLHFRKNYPKTFIIMSLLKLNQSKIKNDHSK